MKDVFLDSYVFAGRWSQYKIDRVLKPEFIREWEEEMLVAGEDPDVYVQPFGDDEALYLASAVNSCRFCNETIVPAPFIMWVDKEVWGNENHLCLACAQLLLIALGYELQNLINFDQIDIMAPRPRGRRKKAQART